LLHPGEAEDVVDQNVEPALLTLDAFDQRAHLGRHEMIDPHRNAAAARLIDQRRRLLDGFRPVHLRAPALARAAGAVDGGAGRT
jgi:hypothetical protein